MQRLMLVFFLCLTGLRALNCLVHLASAKYLRKQSDVQPLTDVTCLVIEAGLFVLIALAL